MALTLFRRDLRTDALPSGYTLTRTGTGSIASSFNSSGVLQFAAANVARFDYDPTTLARKGLLIEESRTNQCKNSNNLSTGWTAANASVGTSSINGPDALPLPQLNQASSGAKIEQNTVVTTVGGTRTASLYAQRISGTAVSTRFLTYVGGNQTIGTFTPGDSLTRHTATQTSSAATNVIFEVGAVTVPAPVSLALGFIQYENGAFATSYIPTGAATATRGADVVTIDTPPVDTSQSFAVVLNYALLPGASAGGYAIHESFSDAFVPIGANGRSVLRFNADMFGWDYHNFGESLQTSTLGDPPGTLTIGSNLGLLSFANATFSGIDWYQGLASDAQMQQLSDGAVLAGDVGIGRQQIGRQLIGAQTIGVPLIG